MTVLLAAAGAVAALLSYTASAWAVHAVTALLFGASLIAAWRQTHWAVPGAGRLLAALAAVGALQWTAGASVHPHATIAATARWTAAALLFTVAVALFRDPEKRFTFLRIFVVFAGALALCALIQPYAGRLGLDGLVSMGADYMVGPFPNRNTYAAFAELALPVAAWLGLRKQGGRWWVTAAAILASVIVTGSRAGAALVAGEVCLLTICSRRWAIGVSLAGVAAIAAATSGETLLTRIGYSDPLAHRRDIYAASLQMIEARPWTGWGLGAYADAYPRFATFDVGRLVDHAHNDWLEWGAEGGIPFLSTAAVFFALAVRNAMRHIWALGLPAVLLHSFVDFPLQRWGVLTWFLLLAGALSATSMGGSGGRTASRSLLYRARSATSRFQRSHARALPTSSTRRFATSPGLKYST